VTIDHRLLNGMQFIFASQPFDGYDMTTIQLEHEPNTGIDGVILKRVAVIIQPPAKR
jgi:hypothetical protein